MLGYARILNTTRGDLYENPLSAGELVRLKSGGPLMTVTENHQGEGMITAMWADKLGAMHTAIFPEQLLQRSKRSFFGRRR